MNEQFINPFTDFGFKKLSGQCTEPNKDLLIDFLNTLLPEHHQISELSYRISVQTGNTVVDRSAIFEKKEEELETHFDRWLYVLKHLPYLHEKRDASRGVKKGVRRDPLKRFMKLLKI